MPYKLWKKPKNATIIQGFPGFGLVGTIATGFLVDHLKCELIGKHWFEETSATVAIHNNLTVSPVDIFYNKQYNIVIVHSIVSPVKGLEWKAADMVLDLAKSISAKEIITIEGVGTRGENSESLSDNSANDAVSSSAKVSAFFFTSKNQKASVKLRELCRPLSEGVVIGVTSALLLKSDLPLSCLFVDAQAQLPDSKAAAKIIQVLDKYLGLKVDYKPLLKQAMMFEQKIKGMLQQSNTAQEVKDKKALSYVG